MQSVVLDILDAFKESRKQTWLDGNGCYSSYPPDLRPMVQLEGGRLQQVT